MALLLTIVAVIAVLLLASGTASGARGAPPPAPPAPDGQLDMLLHDGTDADAARLAEQGVDLGALGYRPPHNG